MSSKAVRLTDAAGVEVYDWGGWTPAASVSRRIAEPVVAPLPP